MVTSTLSTRFVPRLIRDATYSCVAENRDAKCKTVAFVGFKIFALLLHVLLFIYIILKYVLSFLSLFNICRFSLIFIIIFDFASQERRKNLLVEKTDVGKFSNSLYF